MKLAILLYGLEQDKPLLKEIMDKLQVQLNKVEKPFPAKATIDVVFYIDKGEMSIEEKKAWLLGQTVAKKYVFLDEKSVIEDNFLTKRYNAVRTGKTTEQLIELDVYSK